MSVGYSNISAADKPIIRPSVSGLLARDFSQCGTQSARIKLPVGIADQDGRIIDEARVAPLDGRAEILMEEAARNEGFAGWVTTLLNHTVRIDGNFPKGSGTERLAVADRDATVCALRILTFGPEIWGTAQCPQTDCKSSLDVIYDLTGVKIPAGKRGRQEFRVRSDLGPRDINVRYREPTGSDQEALAVLLHSDPEKARFEIISRCLVEAEGIPDTTAEALVGLPEDVVAEIEKIISEGMTSLDWDLEIFCPECGRSFVSTLDIQAYFWEELQITRADFWREVHQLAFYYHWSEQDILSLTRWKRKMYLGHIRRQLGGMTYV